MRKFLHQMVLRKIHDRADTVNAQKRSGAVPLTNSDAATRQLYARALARLADWFAVQPP